MRPQASGLSLGIFSKIGSDFGVKSHQEKYPRQAGILFLVSHVDITWNSFLPYLVKLTDRLEDLGFRYVDNEVIVLKDETDDK